MKINEFNTLVKKLGKSDVDFEFPGSPFDHSYCFDYQGQCFEYLGDEYWMDTGDGSVPVFRAVLGDYDYDYVVDVPELEAELIKEAKKLGIMT